MHITADSRTEALDLLEDRIDDIVTWLVPMYRLLDWELGNSDDPGAGWPDHHRLQDLIYSLTFSLKNDCRNTERISSGRITVLVREERGAPWIAELYLNLLDIKGRL